MSADNYYLIRRHPNGGYAAVMGCASCEGDPEASPQDQQFLRSWDAYVWASAQYTEYGVSFHTECDDMDLAPPFRIGDAHPLRTGDVLYGFCGGYFGRDSYEDKRVEAVGADWVVVRNEAGGVEFADGDPEKLCEYRTPVFP